MAAAQTTWKRGRRRASGRTGLTPLALVTMFTDVAVILAPIIDQLHHIPGYPTASTKPDRTTRPKPGIRPNQGCSAGGHIERGATPEPSCHDTVTATLGRRFPEPGRRTDYGRAHVARCGRQDEGRWAWRG